MKRAQKLLCLLLSLVFMVGLLPAVAPVHAHAEPADACPNCGARNWQQTADGSNCTYPGQIEWTCRNCGYYTYTWATEVNPNAHDWDDGEVTKAAPCPTARPPGPRPRPSSSPRPTPAAGAAFPKPSMGPIPHAVAASACPRPHGEPVLLRQRRVSAGPGGGNLEPQRP